jgi:hypothetical protein
MRVTFLVCECVCVRVMCLCVCVSAFVCVSHFWCVSVCVSVSCVCVCDMAKMMTGMKVSIILPFLFSLLVLLFSCLHPP